MIYLVRHGQTEWNLQGRMQGHLDSPLTDKGKMQVIEVTKKLGLIGAYAELPRVISSPLPRARYTASEIVKGASYANFHLSYSEVPALRERCYGEWEGKVLAEVKETPEWTEYQRNRWEYDGCGVEPYYKFYERVREFWNLVPFHASVIVVCHSRVMAVSLMILADKSLDQVPQKIHNDQIIKISRGSSDWELIQA